jgi:predicted peptidase
MSRWPLAAILLIMSCSTAPPPRASGFLDRTVTVAGRDYPYVVYVPRVRPSGALPVILFLHGAGERGIDGLKPTQVGLGTAIRNEPARVPAIVVFPQAPDDERWIGAPADAAMAALDRTLVELDGDRDRVYLTGLSLGGFGTWHLAMLHPDRFAAIVPICGGIVPAGTASSVRQSPLTEGAADPHAFAAARVRHLPVWIFHGRDDQAILPTESRKMADALNAAGAANVRYTEYEGVGHNAWDRAYGEAALWRWLFAQKR